MCKRQILRRSGIKDKEAERRAGDSEEGTCCRLGRGHTQLHRSWGRGGWQQAKQAEAWLRYLHVCPACPFSLLKLFVLSEEREEEIKNGDTSFVQVHKLFVES